MWFATIVVGMMVRPELRGVTAVPIQATVSCYIPDAC
jgi:hypothetical protein